LPDKLYTRIVEWPNLLEACRKAARGKRGKLAAATFEHQVADRLLRLRHELADFRYQPGAYTHFMIHDPKLRKISAAPFRDRVVHHALCNVIEPFFERRFIYDSYANRVGKGTHWAIDRLQKFARSYAYVLRVDIVKHFPSIDHQILADILGQTVRSDAVQWLIERIIQSGAGVLKDDYEMVYFPGDDLFAVNRPRGLPIGNLTSQFWSNCLMDPFDHFVKRDLRCKAYLRYVDDFALFSNYKRELYRWKAAIVEQLAALRLTIHEAEAQVIPVEHGIPWLGFVVYPDHRQLKARNVVKFSRRLEQRWLQYCNGQITFAEFDASVQGWINHVRYGDTWGLRKHLLGKGLKRPE
jgi:hypothetical protein